MQLAKDAYVEVLNNLTGGSQSMKTVIGALTSSIIILGEGTFACPAIAADEHQVFTPGEVAWGPGPASMPKGAQAVTLYGDASKEGLFVLRIKFPAGYQMPPHFHPKPEVVTVISGNF